MTRLEIVERLFRGFSSGRNPDRMELYARELVDVPLEVLEMAVSGLLNAWEQQSVPPLGAVRRKCHDAQAARSRSLREREDFGIRQGERALSALELESCRLVKLLGRRGVFWSPRERAFVEHVPDTAEMQMPAEAWERPHAAVHEAWARYGERDEQPPSDYQAPLDEGAAPDWDDVAGMFD